MEYNNLPAKRLNEPGGEDKPQIFRTLRNIDLNLLTIFEAVYVHKGIVNAAKILNLTGHDANLVLLYTSPFG